MLEGFEPNRYSVIEEKNKREIVMLIGLGCKWRKCSFCDYHLDYDENPDICFRVNSEVLSKVTGCYGKLEVINSGSVTELDKNTLHKILAVAVEKKIYEIHFECHYLYRKELPAYRELFKRHGIELKLKCGVETFDNDFREKVLKKGMVGFSIEELSYYFDEVCLLFGLKGQTLAGMKRDIEIGLNNFERVCINIMKANTTKTVPNHAVIDSFVKHIYPYIKEEERIDILLDNTDFGVGGE